MGSIYSYLFGNQCVECGESIKYATHSDICLTCLFNVAPSAKLIDDDMIIVKKKSDYNIGKVR